MQSDNTLRLHVDLFRDDIERDLGAVNRPSQNLLVHHCVGHVLRSLRIYGTSYILEFGNESLCETFAQE
ncbi:hypothetical protein ATY31_09545 [Sinorhizobium americanum]|uniref:Uncharacterized protein n=1 Tax=Sinorhizobium americanum TaxID=194963 RepID=A0A2S3YQX8_9HYPH|nr:hypothetical protein ATY31_09545 [Sinorhizobium americanum]